MQSLARRSSRREPAIEHADPGTAAATADTHCPFCSLQCAMTLTCEGSGVTVAARELASSRGGLCRKGWSAAGLLDAGGRLTQPLVRASKDAPLVPVDWDTALDRIASEILRAQGGHGNDSVAIFGGGGLTNEKAYWLGKLARVVLRTSSLDYNGRFCMSSAAVASTRALGLDRGLPFPLEDVAHTDLLILAGANPAETMPPAMQHLEAQAARGGRRIVIDPRRTATAEQATLHLQLTPGTDAALANGLLHLVIRDGLCDDAFIAARTAGFAEIKRSCAAYWPARVERITGVPESALARAARMIGEAPTAMLLTARGSEQHAHGVDQVLAYINLMLAVGKIGRPHCGYGCITGQGNGQGGREHGQKSDQLPGYRKIDDAEHRASVAAVWGIDPADLPGRGLTACEMFERAGDAVRVMLILGANPAVSAPDAVRVQARLARLDLLVVADAFLSETAALADVVLPVPQWAEETGTLTNLEGRVILRRALRPPPPEVRTDLEILCALAGRLGFGDKLPDPTPEAVFAELRVASAGGPADYSGITYARIAAEDGVFWPCPADGHAGTPRLFLDRFATDDGRARFHVVQHVGPAEPPDDEFPYFLTTGRLAFQYQSGAQTRRIPELVEAAREPHVELHPATARTLRVRDGDPVRIETRRGSAVMRARVTAAIRQDTFFVPFHWGGFACANALTHAVLDPASKMPELKVCAARLAPHADAPRAEPTRGGEAQASATVG